MMFDTIKAGDQVVRESLHYSVHDQFHTVERVTKTLVILANGERFKRKDGVIKDPVYSIMQLRFIRPIKVEGRS